MDVRELGLAPDDIICHNALPESVDARILGMAWANRDAPFMVTSVNQAKRLF
jgi:hypothetical protein